MKQNWTHTVWSKIRKRPRSPSDRECAERCYDQCIADGFTEADAVRFTKLTEHITPNLSERYACDRMSEIAAKYPSRRKAGKMDTADEMLTHVLKEEAEKIIFCEGEIAMMKINALLKELGMEKQYVAVYKPQLGETEATEHCPECPPDGCGGARPCEGI